MIVYRPSDRISVKVGDLEIKVSPLTYQQKTELLSLTRQEGGRTVVDLSRRSLLALKKGIREVNGLPDMEFPDGSKVELQWENGELSDESLELLLQVLGTVRSPQLSTALILGRFHDAGEGIVFENAKKKPAGEEEKKTQ